MERRTEVRDFLVSRRGRLSPEQVGLPAGGDRRVAGLRRGEVADLAGVSVEYYARLERGDIAGVSDTVLHAIASALRLSEDERAHLLDLSRAVNAAPSTRTRRRSEVRISPSLQQTLNAVTAAPAFIRNGRMDLLATNELARAFYAPAFGGERGPTNLARFQFLAQDRAREFYRDWDEVVTDTVATLRRHAAQDPYDRTLQDLIGELATRSDEFRRRWGDHDVRRHAAGTKTFRHPLVGEVTVHYEVADLAAATGLTLVIYSAEPGSTAEERLRLLASWVASQDPDADTDVPSLARGR